MNLYLKFITGLLFFTAGLWPLDTLSRRTLNRKQISHIIIETRPDHYRVTLITSNRFPYNYKSQSYPLYKKVADEGEALALSEKLDKFLVTGENMTVFLNGSEIKQIMFGKIK